MKFFRAILLAAAALGACGCTIKHPDPPDVEIYSAVSTDNDTRGAHGGEADTDRDS